MLTESGANAELDTRDVTDALLADASVLYLTGYTLFNRPDTAAFTELIARAVASGVTVAIDPGSAGFITDFGVDRFLKAVAGATIILPNLDEGQLLTGLVDPAEVAAALAELFTVVALTMDVDGIVVAERDSAPVSVAVAHTAAVDPTGAGDSFSAGFLHEWMATGDVALAATAGAALAARAVSMIGARPQV
jgi:sugar/nucleoside kinase (ribokinase family)